MVLTRILVRPGPDGFVGLFFQKVWHILEDDAINVIDLFKQALKVLNSTIIALVPKVSTPRLRLLGTVPSLFILGNSVTQTMVSILWEVSHFLPPVFSINTTSHWS